MVLNNILSICKNWNHCVFHSPPLSIGMLFAARCLYQVHWTTFLLYGYLEFIFSLYLYQKFYRPINFRVKNPTFQFLLFFNKSFLEFSGLESDSFEFSISKLVSESIFESIERHWNFYCFKIMASWNLKISTFLHSLLFS